MKSPVFDAQGYDEKTFAPFWLENCLDKKWQDVRLTFHDWNWFNAKYATDTIDDYYMNGYGIQGLVLAAMHSSGLPVDEDQVHLDSEGDTCNIHFKTMDHAIGAAEAAAAMINDRARLEEMIKVAREKGFED
jgi:hypothetical protein